VIPPRLRAGLVIGAVAVASGIAGAAIDRTLIARGSRRNDAGGRRPPIEQQEQKRRTDMLDRLTTDLSLTPPQRAGLDSIFKRTDSSLRTIRREMQPRLQQVFESSRTEINARLDSTQRVKFAKRRTYGPPREWRGEGRRP
jgi:hypothetical protein